MLRHRLTNLILKSSIFSNYNAMKLKINYKKKSGKVINKRRLKNMLQNNYWVNEAIKEK